MVLFNSPASERFMDQCEVGDPLPSRDGVEEAARYEAPPVAGGAQVVSFRIPDHGEGSLSRGIALHD